MNNVFLGSEDGIGGASQPWPGRGAAGGASASAYALSYQAQPNATGGIGASGGDIDIARASAKNASGRYNVYTLRVRTWRP